jgi:hypothetical protein
MSERNYNPLSEGYTGGKINNTDGKSDSNDTSSAPKNLPTIESAVIKTQNISASDKKK